MSAKCEFCGQEMKSGAGCTVKKFDDFADGVARPRIAYGSETHQSGQDTPGFIHGEEWPKPHSLRTTRKALNLAFLPLI